MNRLYKHIITLILILSFVITGFTADLFGTYDQRIKLTIDHNDIDSDLTWFPVTVFLTSSQGEEVFAEFDADEDFDRVAFTTSDGETQLYADCELFDVSEQKAIYHVSKTGWTVSSSTDTDIYLYYDNTAGHNTTYISKSGGTAAQSVWDSNFKAVYHMNDDEIETQFWACESTGDTSPTRCTLSQESTIVHEGTYSVKMESTDADGFFFYNPSGTWDMSNTKYVRFWVYAEGDYGEDGEIFLFSSESEYAYYSKWENISYSSGWNEIEVDITSTPDRYGALGKCDFSAVTRIRIDLDTSGRTIYLDDFRYVDIKLLDATSNNNDGDKKAFGEPAEATGKVGQGQDFDGTDDYIEGPVIEPDAITVEILANLEAKTDDSRAIGENNTSMPYLIWYDAGNDCWGVRTFDNSANKWQDDDNTSTASTSTWTHLALTYSNPNGVFYQDGSSVISDGVSCSDVLKKTATKLWIGKVIWDYPFEGLIDETRISSTARSTAWIGATYDSLWDNLLTYGNKEIIVKDNAIFFGTNF